MKRNTLLIGLLLLAAAANSALAQESVTTAPVVTEETSIGEDSASVVEIITVRIPKRVGMHLHETRWNLDLGADKLVDCYRAGEHNKDKGYDEVWNVEKLLGSFEWFGGGALDKTIYAIDGKLDTSKGTTVEKNFGPANYYPGIQFDSSKRVIWKGPIMCINRKVVEKFSNADCEWEFTAYLDAPKGFPVLYMGDYYKHRVTGTSAKIIEKVGSKPVVLATGKGTTGGWLDDHILEALVFDGTETAGTYSGKVNFKLTSKP